MLILRPSESFERSSRLGGNADRSRVSPTCTGSLNIRLLRRYVRSPTRWQGTGTISRTTLLKWLPSKQWQLVSTFYFLLLGLL